MSEASAKETTAVGLTEFDLALEIETSDSGEVSRYLDYLPAVYRQNEFMGRFLMIFESVLGPLENVVDELPLYFDPALCPEEMLPYLAHWVAVDLPETLSVSGKRRLIAAASELHRSRGTRRGLKAYLHAMTGITPLIAENTDGGRLGADNRLGLSMQLGHSVPNCITVTLPVNASEEVDADEVAALVETAKPAHAVYLLRIVSRPPLLGQGGGAHVAELSQVATAEEG